MGSLHLNLNKFFGSFSDVITMMMDMGLVSSHVFSYAMTQDVSNVVVEERHLQLFIKFLEEAKDMVNLLSSQLSHCRSKEGFEDIVLGFENRRSLVTDGMNVSSTCNSDGKSHDNAFPSSCGTATYPQMKPTSSLDVQFNNGPQQQYANLNESRCNISSGRFSPLTESQYAPSDALSQNRHYSVADNNSCYDVTASSVGHDNSLSSHSAAFNLPDHLVVNPHFQANCEAAFPDPSTRFPPCSRDASLKQFSSASESGCHDSQYVSHDKSQDFSSKPSCEFAQSNETSDSQHFASRGHFSPTAESNCDTMYPSHCETTQDARFSCDTSFETSNHSGHGMHSSGVPFQTSSEQPINPHYSHSSLPTDASFGDPTKNQHNSAFSIVNPINSSQYATCQSSGEKAQFTTSESAQSKIHYPQRTDMCEATFSQMNGVTNFVGISNETCTNQVTSREVSENRFPHVSNFNWNVASDTDDSFESHSPVQSPNPTQESTELGDLRMAFSNQLEKGISVPVQRKPIEKESLGSAENRFSVILGTRDAISADINRKKTAILDAAKKVRGKWKCPICGDSFLLRTNLERHFNVDHLGEKAFPCSLCEKGFSSKIRLECHLMRQHNVNCPSANTCNVCGKTFRTTTTLKTHSLTHLKESEKPLSCHICNKRFSQKVVLNAHLIRHQGVAALKYHCKECPKGFPSKAKLKFHLKKHENSPLNCKECSKQFTNESLLRAHEATHIAFSERPFQCPSCPKTFTAKYKLKCHMETHSEIDQYTCPSCSAEYRCRSSLSSHIRKCHQKEHSQHSNPPSECSDSNPAFSNSQQPSQLDTSEEPRLIPEFKCSFCLRPFGRKSNLVQHEKVCHQGKASLFSCNHANCTKSFKTKAKLKFHLATHTEKPNLSCRTCGKRFYRPDLLRVHEATHTGNKPFSCDVCARRFATQAILRTHQIIHKPPPTSAEVPCPTCGKKFKNNRTLNEHTRSHAPILPFKCGTCGKQFARRVHFDGHMRTHSADRPYSCTVCNRTFRERKHRAEHMKRLHPNETLGGGELTLQKLIDSITADDTMDAPTGGGSSETDVNSDALASLTELSNSGMQHLLEDSSQRNIDPHVDDTSQSQGSQMDSTYSTQSGNLTLQSQVDGINQTSQVNHLNQSFSSQTHNLDLDCQADIVTSSRVNHLPAQSQNLSVLQNPFHDLKTAEVHPFSCSNGGDLDSLPQLSNQLESMDTCSNSHSGLHSHYTHGCEGKSTFAGSSEESLPKLSDVLAISMQGDL